MFSYHLPDGDLTGNSYFNTEGKIKFDPPVYEQRYTTVIKILEDERWQQHFKKVVDFGCGEMRLLPLLRRVNGMEHILEVDIDEALLEGYKHRAKPLISDYLQKRENPLRIEVLKGSIDASVDNLRNVDAVTAVEIVEHLYQNTLENVPANIFGFMQPKLAIFTTPNSEFNVLFQPLLANGFRHLDHKFEWTRAEFKSWATNICKLYQNYEVAIIGIGKAPPDHKKIGHVTQVAIFARKDILGKALIEPIKENIPANVDADVQYKEIYSVDFPFSRDERTKEEKLLDEARAYISRCRNVELYFNRERCIYQLPLSRLLDYTKTVGATAEELLTVLNANSITVENDFIILPDYDEEEEAYNHRYGDDCYDDCNDDEYNCNAADAEYDKELTAGRYVSEDSEENWD